MRRKKHKHTRKSVSFYKVNHGFREPFKVLLDGNFIHATLQANLVDLDDHISRLLGGPCKLYTTRCIGHELRQLGADTAPAAAAATRTALHHCRHDRPLPACECLLAQVGAANAGHWWVATQDKALQRALAALPAAPVVFASVNGLHLAEPSAGALAAVAAAQAVDQGVPHHERPRRDAGVEDEVGGEEEEEGQARRRMVGSGGAARFRRKKAKGPNPLAVKKKKHKGAGSGGGRAAQLQARGSGGGGGGGGGSTAQADAGGGGGGGKRRRRSKSSNAGQAPGGAAAHD